MKKDKKTYIMEVYIYMYAKNKPKGHHIFKKHQHIYLFKIHFRIKEIILKFLSTFARKPNLIIQNSKKLIITVAYTIYQKRHRLLSIKI